MLGKKYWTIDKNGNQELRYLEIEDKNFYHGDGILRTITFWKL